VVGGVVMLVLYQIVARALFSAPYAQSFDQGLDLFRWLRHVLRFRLYRDIVPAVIPHIVLLAVILIAALRAFRRDTAERRPLLLALVVALLGVAIGRFHTASFPYFWITIGLFPACTIAIGYAGIRELLPRVHAVVIAAAWLVMLAMAVRYRVETLDDTQAIQRESFGLVERLPGHLRGFNTDGGLVCRADPKPLPAFFGTTITQAFYGANGDAFTASFLAEHRSRPIAFIVRSNRVNFPDRVKAFWDTHYVPYRAAVWLAGRTIIGPRDAKVDVDILVAGRYRWLPRNAARIVIDGTELASDQVVELAAGPHVATIASPLADGMLVLVVDEPPGTTAPFYDRAPVLELSGVRGRWWRRVE
jgi:hypothetical protein